MCFLKKLNKKIKISFTGDILCDLPELKYLKKNNMSFFKIFHKYNVKDDSDFLVGNLETPICSGLPYTFEPFSFNTPNGFAKELKKIGFDLVSVANNHCLDRGGVGAKNTIKNLKKINLIPSGIYEKDEKNYDIVNILGKKIAFISYTYGTNYNHNKYDLCNCKNIKINLLKKQTYLNKYSYFCYFCDFLKKYIKASRIWKLLSCIKNSIQNKNKVLPKAYIKDDINEDEWIIDENYIKDISTTVLNAKNEADLVIFLLHSGGQFNGEVGTFTSALVKKITELDVDLIIGNHPHIVQKYEIINGKPVFYSLGNFIFSPCSSYVNFEYMPEYSIKVNFYIDTNFTFTFEILKVVCNYDNFHSEVYNTYDLQFHLNDLERKKLISDCNFIINRLYETVNVEYINSLKKEYELKEVK